MDAISTIKLLIAQWPSRKNLADDIGVSLDRVNKWAQTQSIPAKFHAGVLRSAIARSIVLTADDLTRLHDVDDEEDAA